MWIPASSGAELESRIQGSKAKAKDTKKSEIKAKDSPSENRPSRGLGQECSRKRPRTMDIGAKCSQKKGLKKFFFNFSGDLQNFNNSKNSAVLEPRIGQFSRTWGIEAKAKNLTFEL